MNKILQVTSKLFRGGAESFIMNVYRNIDRENFQFDFLVFHSQKEYYEDEILALGGHIYHLPIMEKTNILKRRSMLNTFFDQHHNYNAVHCHMAALGRECLMSAEKYGVKTRIAHSHIANFEHNFRGFVKRAFEKGFDKSATLRFACSESAGKYMYGEKDFQIIKNGINTSYFAFDEAKRQFFRNSLDIPASMPLVGHAGRFEIMKNHSFLINIFERMVAKGFPGKLVLAGEGSLRRQIQRQVEEKGLNDKVIFLGAISDMSSFYSGIDIFVMPSLFEGLPFSVIEAQCSGLPCVLSDSISEECKLASNVIFFSLKKTCDDWANLLAQNIHADENRFLGTQIVKKAGYDITDTVNVLETYYAS